MGRGGWGLRGLCTRFTGPPFPASPSLLCSSSFHLEDALTAVGEKVCLEVSSCLSLCGLSPLTTEKEAVLKGQIQAVASPDNPIRRIVGTSGGSRGQGCACDGLADIVERRGIKSPLCGEGDPKF